MTPDMNDDAPDVPCPGVDAQRATRFAAEAMNLLPTLQRNALRKIFDRPDFLPEEVAQLGYKRLQQAEGIGSKGLEAITAWLKNYGFELTVPPVNPQGSQVPRRVRQSIEQALQLLRTHGYEVIPQANGAGRSKEQR